LRDEKPALTFNSNSFVTLSTVLEGVGTSAYLGGAPLLQDKDILTTAGAILVTEALHTSQQRVAIGEVPAALDLGTPLDANSVFTLASSFIVECPAENAALPFKANPGLAVDTTACSAPAGQPLFKRGQEVPGGGILGPIVVPSKSAHVAPAMIAEAEAHVQTMAAAKQEVEAKQAEIAADPQVQHFQQQAQALQHEKAAIEQKFGEHAKGLVDATLMGGHAQVVAAQPCPFLAEGQAVTFNADAEVPQGSFVSFVAGLSVISVPAQIAGQQAAVAVPAGVSGQVYAFVTNREISDNKLPADAIAFGPAIIEG
jgi:hypothetical protein